MAEPFLSEIRIASFNFPPKGWAFCNGQTFAIAQNQALFSLLGTTFGGNGVTTFALPNLQGRVPIHVGNGYTLGQTGGAEAVTINASTMPSHTHAVTATSRQGTEPSASGNVLAATSGNQYGAAVNPTALNPASVSTLTSGGQPHLNMQPYLTLSFIIALQGIFPSQT
jgi:microcystin-dependent protein